MFSRCRNAVSLVSVLIGLIWSCTHHVFLHIDFRELHYCAVQTTQNALYGIVYSFHYPTRNHLRNGEKMLLLWWRRHQLSPAGTASPSEPSVQ